MVGYVGTSGVGREEWAAIEPRCKRVPAKGGTETEEAKGGDPMQEAAAEG